MIDPKSFYRKMDALLSRMHRESGEGDFLPSIMKAFEAAFGADLGIRNGRLYQEGLDSFILVEETNPDRQPRPPARIPIDSPAVREVLQYGSYIFDKAGLGADFGYSDTADYAIPSAFAVVRGPNTRWVFVYDLLDGWIREEVDLSMNAVRAALNYQLSSENIKSTLEQATLIQKSLLPSTPPKVKGYELAGRSQAAEMVGGDFYDFLLFEDDTFGVSIGDASGHGLPAALLVRDVVTGLRMGMEGQMKMVYTIRKLNHVIHRSTFSTRFTSLFYGEIEDNGNLIYVNAGHPAPFMFSKRGVQELETTGMLIGPLAELPLRRAYAYFEPGAVLVFYTDGILERISPEHELYGPKRLKALIAEHKQLTAEKLVELIFDRVYAFGGEGPWEDDATVVVIKRTMAS